MKRFVKMVNGWKSLTIITKCSILDITAVLDPPLTTKAYLDSCQTYMVEYFCETIYKKKLHHIYWQGSKYTYKLLTEILCYIIMNTLLHSITFIRIQN